MRLFTSLRTSTKPPTSPQAKVPSGPHSDKLWKIYKGFIDSDPGQEDGSSGYYITDTILDLDADKSPATRPYTEADHQEQIKKWGTNHALVALTSRMHAFRDEIEVAKITWGKKLEKYDARYITERDILSMALLGPGPSSSEAATKKKKNVHGQLSYEFLEGIGIHRLIAEDISLTVRYLAHRQKTQQTQHVRYPRRETTDAIAYAFGDQSTSMESEKNDRMLEIHQLKSIIRKSDTSSIPRVLYPLLNDEYGRGLVAECSKEIVQGMTKTTATTTTTKAKSTEPRTKSKKKSGKDVAALDAPTAQEHQNQDQDQEQQQEEEEVSIRARIFLKNLAYNLVTKGNLPAHLVSTWSKILEGGGPANEESDKAKRCRGEREATIRQPEIESDIASTTTSALSG